MFTCNDLSVLFSSCCVLLCQGTICLWKSRAQVFQVSNIFHISMCLSSNSKTWTCVCTANSLCNMSSCYFACCVHLRVISGWITSTSWRRKQKGRKANSRLHPQLARLFCAFPSVCIKQKFSPNFVLVVSWISCGVVGRVHARHFQNASLLSRILSLSYHSRYQNKK